MHILVMVLPFSPLLEAKAGSSMVWALALSGRNAPLLSGAARFGHAARAPQVAGPAARPEAAAAAAAGEEGEAAPGVGGEGEAQEVQVQVAPEVGHPWTGSWALDRTLV